VGMIRKDRAGRENSASIRSVNNRGANKTEILPCALKERQLRSDEQLAECYPSSRPQAVSKTYRQGAKRVLLFACVPFTVPVEILGHPHRKQKTHLFF